MVADPGRAVGGAGLAEEAAQLQNPTQGLEERLALLLTVITDKLACVLVLDGLESALDEESGQFLEPAMAFFWNGFQKQSAAVSRLLLSSRLLPMGDGQAISSAGLRHERLGPGMAERSPAFQAVLDQLDGESRQALRSMMIFHYPMAVEAYQALTRWSRPRQERFLQQLQALGLALAVRAEEGALLWSLHPLLRQLLQTDGAAEKKMLGKALTRAGRYLQAQAQQVAAGQGAVLRWRLLAEGVAHLLQAVPLRRRDLFAALLGMADPLCDAWQQSGFYWELEHLNRALLTVRSHPRVLYRLAMAVLRRQERQEAEALLQQVAMQSTDEYAKERALALFELAGLALQADPEAAKTYLLQALALNQAAEDRSGQAVCHAHLGFWGLRQADMTVAQRHLEAALRLCRALNDAEGIANLLTWNGELYWRVGNVVAARDHFQEALQRLCAGSHADREAQLRQRLAIMDLAEEQYEQALLGFLGALQLHRAGDNRRGEAVIFFQLGRLAKAKGKDLASLQFLGLSQRLGETLGDPDAGQLLVLFRELAVTILRMNRLASQLLLDGVWLSYCQDRGDTLIQQAFVEGAP
jgi:tetratricopeptide (TPR) repeat protein